MCSFEDNFAEFLEDCTSWRWNDDKQEHDEYLNWRGHMILGTLRRLSEIEEREGR